MREYVVTLKNRDDLEQFYDDMETPGGDLYIPGRAVEVANRREISRNTHYYLTDQEAELLRNDARVLAVELTPSELGMRPRPHWVQTETTWNKSSTNNSTHKNWGLYRSITGSQVTGWGSDGTASTSGTISTITEGANVDVVIVDGHINPLHPEYAVNSDGTGGSRVIQYNWFQHNSTVWPANPSSTYVYTPYVDAGDADLTADNNHGAHVAGTVAGNTQGWARKSNIYNINPYSTNPNTFDTLYLIDYIRAFHAAKSINPAIGRKNPTITNHSWGYGYQLLITNISSIVYRGTTVVSGVPTVAQLGTYGIDNDGTYVYAPARYTALEADIADAIDDGIIFVGAASNDYTKIDIPGGQDYNNYFVSSIFGYYYHRGSTPGAAPDVICVGAVGSLVNDSKAPYSNSGPRIDVYAPGSNIMSSLNSTTSFGGVDDPRNSAYKIGKINGTSMASPQVAGMLACAMEIYPDLSQQDALNYVAYYSKKNQVFDTGSTNYTDVYSLQGSTNNYLFYYRERSATGNVWPKVNYLARPASGSVYPRSSRRTYQT
jgi:hypothetical protein